MTLEETILDQPSPREVVGRIVKEAREKAGMSQRDLALAADLGQSHIARIEQGRYNLKIDTLMAIVNALGLKVKIE